MGRARETSQGTPAGELTGSQRRAIAASGAWDSAALTRLAPTYASWHSWRPGGPGTRLAGPRGGRLLYGVGALLGSAVLFGLGSPWIGAKALATASPAFVLLALVAAAALAARGRRVEAAVVAAGIAGGVLWSNVLAYREAWLAPRERLAELEAIGDRYAGRGGLMTEFEPYGARTSCAACSRGRVRVAAARDYPSRRESRSSHRGTRTWTASASTHLVYRTLVLRRSPSRAAASVYGSSNDAGGRSLGVASRRGTHRQRSLGNAVDPAAVPRCATCATRVAPRDERIVATTAAVVSRPGQLSRTRVEESPSLRVPHGGGGDLGWRSSRP